MARPGGGENARDARSMSERPWFVLRVQSRMELEAEKRIRVLGFSAMSPYREVWHRIRAGRPRKRRYALFPTYTFVCLPDPDAGWQAIQGALNTELTRMAYNLLPSSDAPLPIAPKDVEYLASIADGKYRQDEDVHGFKVGDSVVIPAGPFKDIVGTILRILRGKKATLEIKEAKIASTVEIPLANLEKL
jgi:transcription antitermination factor NusG